MITTQCSVVIVFLSIISRAISETCLTSDNIKGNCVALKDCSSMYTAGSDYVNKNRCGKDRRVCCKQNSEPVPNYIATSDLLPDISKCGLLTSGKIVGGKMTSIDEFPWMALLQYRQLDGSKTFECGGTLISKRYVLTAAHCLTDKLIGVRLGEHNTDTARDCVTLSFGSECAPLPIDIEIEEKVIHSAYLKNTVNHYNDIGLIRLKHDVNMSDFVNPICLPLTYEDLNETLAGKNLTVAGWGQTEQLLKSPIKLKAKLPVYNLDHCEHNYRKLNSNFGLKESQICAGGAKDSCRGDSGGPLMHFKTNHRREPSFYIVGIVSFGPSPCGLKNLPGVYTKVAHYAKWIVDNLKP